LQQVLGKSFEAVGANELTQSWFLETFLAKRARLSSQILESLFRLRAVKKVVSRTLPRVAVCQIGSEKLENAWTHNPLNKFDSALTLPDPGASHAPVLTVTKTTKWVTKAGGWQYL
jgi:hypothetical protein